MNSVKHRPGKRTKLIFQLPQTIEAIALPIPNANLIRNTGVGGTERQSIRFMDAVVWNVNSQQTAPKSGTVPGLTQSHVLTLDFGRNATPDVSLDEKPLTVDSNCATLHVHL